jgi:hypothetical protein
MRPEAATQLPLPSNSWPAWPSLITPYIVNGTRVEAVTVLHIHDRILKKSKPRRFKSSVCIPLSSQADPRFISSLYSRTAVTDTNTNTTLLETLHFYLLLLLLLLRLLLLQIIAHRHQSILPLPPLITTLPATRVIYIQAHLYITIFDPLTTPATR